MIPLAYIKCILNSVVVYKWSMTTAEIFTNLVFEPSILLGNLFYAIALVCALYRKRTKNNVWYFLGHIGILFLFEVLLTMLFAFALNKFFHLSFFIKAFLVSALYIIPIPFFDNKNKLTSKISIACCIFAMFFVLGEIGGSVPIIVQNIAYSKEIDAVVRNIINGSIVFFGMFVGKFNLNKINKLPSVSIIFLIAYSICEFLLAFYSGTQFFAREFNVAVFQFLAFAMIAFLSVLSYYMIYQICNKNDQFIQLQQRNYELEKDQELIKVSNENVQKMRAMGHDMKNQYATIKLLVEKKEYEELDKYLQNFQDGVIQPVNFISCDNDIISSVMNMEYSKARASQIDFDSKIAVRKQIPFNSVDLVSLLSNVIDNAIEACVYYHIEKPVISIRIREYEQYLYIEVANPIKEGVTLEELKKKKTTKEDKTIHGFGNKIIKQIVKKYDGMLERNIENGKYFLKIMLMEGDKNHDENRSV